MTNETVFVASPRAMGKMPLASGSSVPACPALPARSSRLTIAVARDAVGPTGLSSTNQPCTEEADRALVILAFGLDIAAHARIAQQVGHPLRGIERFVGDEAQLRCKFEMQRARYLAAQPGRRT